MAPTDATTPPLYEPRWMTTTDNAWIKLQGSDQVDIANTAYPDLPSDWQAENLAAAARALSPVRMCRWRWATTSATRAIS